jgi:hypothetical protein
MSGQLAAIIGDLESASTRLRDLREALPRHIWSRQPGPGQWSPAECIAHLNLSSAAILPCLRDALAAARACSEPVGSKYRLDAMGWLLGKIVAPGGGLKMTAPAAFEPDGCDTADCLVDRFETLQAELIALVRDADGLPIDRVSVVSPFDARVKCNLYAALMLVARHQHRHLLQAAHAAERYVAAAPLLLHA